MICKYSYLTKAKSIWEDEEYHGPFQADIEDFKKFFFDHRPENVTCVYVKLPDNRCFTWNEFFGNDMLYEFADRQEETSWL